MDEKLVRIFKCKKCGNYFAVKGKVKWNNCQSVWQNVNGLVPTTITCPECHTCEVE